MMMSNFNYSPILASVNGIAESPSLYRLIVNYFGLASDFLEWEDLAYSLFIAILISLIFSIGLRKKETFPKGLQNFLEWVVEHLRDYLKTLLGEDADKHLPFIGTLFVYLFFMNTISLIPFMKSPTSNLSVTAAMAIVVFCRVQYYNIKHMGIKGFMYHMCGSPQGVIAWIIAPMMFFIEILTQLTRPVTLALRLTGNMMGEHILVGVFTLFAVAIFSTNYIPIGLPVQLPVMLFGLLTSTIQAVVFTLLTAIYIYLSKEDTSETSHK